MVGDEEQAILSFLREESPKGHFDSTTTEIARGTNMSYNQVARLLERLMFIEQVGCRERGTNRKMVRYFCLREVLDLCREKWLCLHPFDLKQTGWS